MKKNMSTVFHFQTDGQTKRMNQTLEQYFRLFTGDNKHKWVELLPTTQMAVNKSYNENLKQSPHEALYGTILKTVEIGPTINQTASTFAARMKNNWAAIGIRITRARQKVKKKLDTKKTPVMIKPGDKTLLSTRHLTNDKLDTPYIGAFRMLNVKNTHNRIILTKHVNFPKIPRVFDKESSIGYTINYNMELFNKRKIRNRTDITKKTKGSKGKISGKMEKL